MARPAISLFRVLWELLRYDLLFACRGMEGVRPAALATGAENEVTEREICQAVQSATPFYWKAVRCLQRSTVTVRLMRGQGIPAEVVIGYRPTPFFSHAWVEVGGRVSNDSPVYQARLQILDRF
jgi:hypothetical protein